MPAGWFFGLTDTRQTVRRSDDILPPQDNQDLDLNNPGSGSEAALASTEHIVN